VIKNIKVRKSLVWTLKLLLFIGVLYFFVQQISRIEWSQIHSIQLNHPIYLILVLFLLPLNWGLELMKWRIVLKSNKIDYTLMELTHSLFSGVTTGILTPNRIGNFIGRMMFFKGKVRGQLILGTLYSNYAQFLVTIFFGAFSFILLHEIIFDTFGVLLTDLSILISALSFLFYFSVPFIPLKRLKFLNKKQNILIQFQFHAKNLLLPLLLYSGIRYLVFSVQFLLMLMAFGVIPSLVLYAGVLMLYLVSTLTPSLLFGKLLIRETAGLIILGFFIENDAIIVTSSLLLWFVNLGVPSIMGLFFILRKKSFANA